MLKQNLSHRPLLLISMFALVGIVSCGVEDIAKAKVTVVEEQAGPQIQLTQVPVAGATVRFYSDRMLTDHITSLQTSGSTGEVSFEYPYEAYLFYDATLGTRESNGHMIHMVPGETVSEQVVLPQ